MNSRVIDGKLCHLIVMYMNYWKNVQIWSIVIDKCIQLERRREKERERDRET